MLYFKESFILIFATHVILFIVTELAKHLLHLKDHFNICDQEWNRHYNVFVFCLQNSHIYKPQVMKTFSIYIWFNLNFHIVGIGYPPRKWEVNAIAHALFCSRQGLSLFLATVTLSETFFWLFGQHKQSSFLIYLLLVGHKPRQHYQNSDQEAKEMKFCCKLLSCLMHFSSQFVLRDGVLRLWDWALFLQKLSYDQSRRKIKKSMLYSHGYYFSIFCEPRCSQFERGHQKGTQKSIVVLWFHKLSIGRK